LGSPSLRNTIIAISVALIPALARVVYANTLSLREQPFVEAARAVGMSETRIAISHVLQIRWLGWNGAGTAPSCATVWSTRKATLRRSGSVNQPRQHLPGTRLHKSLRASLSEFYHSF
jgi:Binding-protein-dependent transport system inner membrane component